MAEKARRFISRIRREKARNDGDFLVKKQEEEKKKMEEHELR